MRGAAHAAAVATPTWGTQTSDELPFIGVLHQHLERPVFHKILTVITTVRFNIAGLEVRHEHGCTWGEVELKHQESDQDSGSTNQTPHLWSIRSPDP